MTTILSLPCFFLLAQLHVFLILVCIVVISALDLMDMGLIGFISWISLPIDKLGNRQKVMLVYEKTSLKHYILYRFLMLFFLLSIIYHFNIIRSKS